jgi:lipopolysaccharide transport system ATP-binding protein
LQTLFSISEDASPVIRVERLGKRYRLGRDHADSLVDLFGHFWGRLTRTESTPQTPRRREFWAIKDVGFQVSAGEVFGIIGKNGAGKSTLLKLLSRVIAPTCGHIELTGRAASLLEVGTGFHPDLTGKENIYMNASLLGMSRMEVAQKYDQIVEFAGVKDFLGTPVKRYSSGMRVRLGFAVAAHLEPEILIIDEVLTVGDAEFQKKCLGKMQTVATEGRTVLFVSHNMAAVRSLCSRACFLEEGTMVAIGETDHIVQTYLAANGQQSGWRKIYPANQLIWIGGIGALQPNAFGVRVCDGESQGVFTTEQSILFSFEFVPKISLKHFRVGLAVKNSDGITMFGSNTALDELGPESVGISHTMQCRLPSEILNRGTYSVDLAVDCPTHTSESFRDEECIQFEVIDVQGHGVGSEPLPGVIRPKLSWKLQCSAPKDAG